MVNHEEKLKEVQEELKGKGYEVTIYPAKSKSGTWHWCIKENDDTAEIEVNTNSQRVGIKDSKNVTKKTVQFLLGELEKWLHGLNWKFIEVMGGEDVLEQVGYVKIGSRWYKELNGKDSFFSFARRFKKTLQKSTKEIECCSFQLDISDDYVKVDFRTMYQKKQLLAMQKKNGKIKLKNEKGSAEYDEEGCVSYIEEWLKKGEKEGKLQSVFQKSHPHLMELLEKKYDLKVSNGTKDRISSELMKYFSYETIEKLAKEREEKTDIRLVYKEFTRQAVIIPFENVFLFMINEQVEVGHEKERYVREFKEKIVEWSFGKDKTLALNEL